MFITNLRFFIGLRFFMSWKQYVIDKINIHIHRRLKTPNIHASFHEKILLIVI